MELELSPLLDVDALAKAYAKVGRGQVRGILTPASAARIYQCLTEETPWGLVYNDDPKVIEVSHEQLLKMTPEDFQNLNQQIYIRAQRQYQYLYHFYPMLTSYLSGENKDFFLHRVLEFLNSEPMLDFIRTLTGIPEIIKADGQATLYKANNFLNLHYDEDTTEGWRAAYVLNFTKEWHHDWGGYLQFFDDDLNVEEAFRPIFNALNVFTVPKPHSVNYIPKFCPGARLSITGWFRDK